MKKVITLLLFLLSFHLSAQINFRVVDGNSNLPLENVRVKAAGQPILRTDTDGNISVPESNTILVSFALEGYETLENNFGPGNYEILLIPSTLNLATVTVSAFESERPILEQSASISVISERDFNRFNETSIVNSFNTKPGIRIEERAPASYRISIRGSSLRAPFGVRNVKVYWNEVPFTSPDGTTALNLLDLSNIRTAEVIKGPSGSIYGAGNGGVVSLASKADPNGGRVSTDFSAGSFGMTRFRLGLSQQIGKGGFDAAYVQQKSDGYREQSAMDRKVFQLGGYFPVSENQEIRTQLLISDLN
ncbi:TonB-dependent receptor plug domain-containing protein, partial [Algoriphagus sp.]|uniref:TonB-dependent receptor plug domain-containing protein n=1 Tax=Algoriphagus sp. TaxID=1872435 RepID=UPI0025EE8726